MDEIIELQSGDFVEEKRKHYYLPILRDFLTLPDIHMLCLNEVFDDMEIHYMGHLWVTFEFKSKEACQNCMANDDMNDWLLEDVIRIQKNICLQIALCGLI